jgi:polyisoprenoid-binding protein YceI
METPMKKISIALVSVLALSLGACKKKEEAPAPVPTEPAKTEPAPAAPPDAAEAPADAAEPAVDEKADYINVEAGHAEPKPTDPVVVKFEKFTVTKTEIKDLANLEGSKAEIEIDLTSLKTDSEKRDAHLNSPDYLETAKTPKATVKIDKVKKAGENKYTAEAKVSAHGITDKKFPVAFEVVETTADSVRVKGEHKFELKDFKLGKEKDEGVASTLLVKLQLTFKKS